jgi:hypothetical protein
MRDVCANIPRFQSNMLHPLYSMYLRYFDWKQKKSYLEKNILYVKQVYYRLKEFLQPILQPSECADKICHYSLTFPYPESRTQILQSLWVREQKHKTAAQLSDYPLAPVKPSNSFLRIQICSISAARDLMILTNTYTLKF